MAQSKYNHKISESKVYSYWEKNKLFKPKKNKKSFSIVIPPPNITGSLHMGHALNNSIQDVLSRYYRMNNYETLWQPGTDHAGIATQALVEKNLKSKGIDKNEIRIKHAKSIGVIDNIDSLENLNDLFSDIELGTELTLAPASGKLNFHNCYEGG